MYGLVNTGVVYWNLPTPALYAESVRNREGFIAHLGPYVVRTGHHTGRSPKDKFIVKEASSESKIWWGKENRPFDTAHFDALYYRIMAYLQGKQLYVQDCYAGADQGYRLPIRVVTETAWHSLFARNMFIREYDRDKLAKFDPQFCVVHIPNFHAVPDLDATNSEAFIILNFERKMALIGGTSYAGEIKKAVFTVMNYFLPQKDVLSMHCSANVGEEGDTAIFFGLSGTGKTTLSTDPKRALIGDDEHGWDDDGVFNFEGGCYAKTINLSKESEPDIFHAIRRDALLENVVIADDGKVDFDDGSKTQNTRVSYPIYHIDNIVKPVSKAGHAQKVIFLTADAFGVMPPVSKLTPEQTKYHFLSGFTAKLAGTERGITDPVPSFSACFGAAFLTLHPTKYGEELVKRMEAVGSTAYLVNTGWNGTGKRISIKNTRCIIDCILDGSLDHAETKQIPYFNLEVPLVLPGVDCKILDPRDTYEDPAEWERKAKELAKLFISNFDQFTDNEEGMALVEAGPQL